MALSLPSAAVGLLLGLAMMLPSTNAATAQDWNPNLCLQEYKEAISGLTDSSETEICAVLFRLKQCLQQSSLSMPTGSGENLTITKTAEVDRVMNIVVAKELRRHGVNCKNYVLSPSSHPPQLRHSLLQLMAPLGTTKRTNHPVQKRSAMGLAVRLAMDSKTRQCVLDNLGSDVLDLDTFCDKALSMTKCSLRGMDPTGAQALVPDLQTFLKDLSDEYHKLCNIAVDEVMTDVLGDLHDSVKPVAGIWDKIVDLWRRVVLWFTEW